MLYQPPEIATYLPLYPTLPSPACGGGQGGASVGGSGRWYFRRDCKMVAVQLFWIGYLAKISLH